MFSPSFLRVHHDRPLFRCIHKWDIRKFWEVTLWAQVANGN